MTLCSGCHLPLETNSRHHKCIFHHRGFTITNISYQPCNVFYHPHCIKVGAPFQTRHFGKGTRGLQFPPCATILPFICELCTVRSHLQREIDPYVPTDDLLLRLERMRMVDVAHAWAPRTLENACRTLRRIEKFFLKCQLPSIHHQMQLPSLEHPLIDMAIPMFWSMENYTSYPSTKDGSVPSWNTGRSQRSALSLYSSWTSAFCYPHQTYKDNDNRLLSVMSISPSDNILSRMTAGDIASRLGTESRPSHPLSHQHIHWNQKYRSNLLNAQSSLLLQYEIVAAQCVELIAWLGWLRSSELFKLTIDDIELVPPKQGAIYGLPPNVGAVLFTLLPSTKSSRNRQVDIVVAWQISSDLCLGYWISRLFKLLHQLEWYTPSSFLFRSSTSTPWSSLYFRSNHLYPLLHLQRIEGDVQLCHINITTSNDISYHFYSLHSYRRGAQSNTIRPRQGCQRRALPHEVNDHGRWRVRNTGKEDMPTHYRTPSVEDMIYLTLLCF